MTINPRYCTLLINQQKWRHAQYLEGSFLIKETPSMKNKIKKGDIGLNFLLYAYIPGQWWFGGKRFLSNFNEVISTKKINKKFSFFFLVSRSKPSFKLRCDKKKSTYLDPRHGRIFRQPAETRIRSGWISVQDSCRRACRTSRRRRVLRRRRSHIRSTGIRRPRCSRTRPSRRTSPSGGTHRAPPAGRPSSPG